MFCTGETAKQIFERSHLPNEILGCIWNLADTEQKGELGLTEFIIAMHLLASFRNGSMRALPQILPAGLYEAAARRGQSRQPTGSRPSSGALSGNPVARHFSGSGFLGASSPEPKNIQPPAAPATPISEDWAVSNQDKESFDRIYATVDTVNRGYITGEQAVGFFSNSRLPEEALAQIWDLADINSEGRLNRDEFAVAMFLIRQQRTKKDGRDVLPRALPLNLIPPSMRRRPIAPPQPTAPIFGNTANISVPRSASEDLFGLDAFTSPAAQVPQSTGDSGLYSVTPPPGPVSPQIPQPIQQSSTFKPFVPSSSFGQAMMTPQSTGFSKRPGVTETKAAPLQSPSAADDLLGDNDPEVSKKLTQETTELANLSNQVSNLTSQMQEVKSKTLSTEQDLSKAQSQKRDFEVRLSQLRAAYEHEVANVKALEEQLLASRSEIKKLEHDMALIDGTYQDLQNQHGQVASALDMDQKENSRLKEQIRLTNSEVNELKPQLEKMKSELRHQKGLVTINKKQLAINESERDKLTADLQETSKELNDTTREVEESALNLEAKSEPKPAPATSPPTLSPNMNPFLRRTPTLPSEKGLSSPFTSQAITSPNHDAFDSFFGPALGSSNTQPGPPPTTFRTNSPGHFHGSTPPAVISTHETSTQSVKSFEDPDIPTPSDSPPPSIFNDSPQATGVPPAPPQSRQMTSSFLPLRNLQRTDSTSSSVKVIPPASRMGYSPSSDTPADPQQSVSGSPGHETFRQEFEESDAKSTRVDSLPSSLAAIQQSAASGNTRHQIQPPDHGASPLAQSSTSREIPGAFPGDSTPPLQPDIPAAGKNAFDSTEKSIEPSTSQVRDPFNTLNDRPKTPNSARDDFNAAFEGFGKAGKLPEKSNGSTVVGQTGPSKPYGEFPPIQDVGADEDSDSEYSDRGFDDNFIAASPRRPQTLSDESISSFPQQANQANLENYLSPSRPQLSTTESNQSQLPTPGAQLSPPTYNQTVASHAQAGQPSEPNQFPAEYTGLLPSRENPISSPTSPPLTVVSEKVDSPTLNEKGLGLVSSQVQTEQPHSSFSPSILSPLAPGASAAPYAYEQNSTKPALLQAHPPIPAKTALNDDFDNEFGDLSEAKEADDKADDEFASASKGGFDEFNPVFDSPAPSRSTAHPSVSTFPGENDLRDFESSAAGSNHASNSRQTANQVPSTSNPDWDAIFAGLETPQNNGVQADTKPVQTFSPEIRPQASTNSAAQSSKPQLPRGLSSGTEHDDPILKRLTGMGYPRDMSLKALEKFDYNIDKVGLSFSAVKISRYLLTFLIGCRLLSITILVVEYTTGRDNTLKSAELYAPEFSNCNILVPCSKPHRFSSAHFRGVFFCPGGTP